jgi:AraC-like DNA-binding protein
MQKRGAGVSSERPLVLKYLYGGVAHYRAGDTLALRVLPDYELVLIIEGRVTYFSNGEKHEVSPGSLIFARPGFRENYVWDPAARTRHAYIHFDIEQMPGDWPPFSEWPVVHKQPDPVITPMFRYLIGRIAAHPEWPTLKPGADENRLMECLTRILLEPTGQNRLSVAQGLPEPVHQSLNLMREAIDRATHQPMTLQILAKRAGVTEKHLCRLFQEAFGQPPMKTFRLLKLQLSLTLLGRSNLTIKEIANRCGFDNALYFTRCFTQTYGSSPTETRKSLLRQEPPPPNSLPPEITPRIYW